VAMEQSALDFISEQYKLSKLTYLGEPEHGLITQNAIVADEEGIKYFIKNHRAAHLEKLDKIEQSASFIASHGDVPVILALPNKNGELHTATEDSALSVYLYIEHKKYVSQSLEEEVAFRGHLGAMLGKIHAASRNAVIPESIDISNLYRPMNIERFIIHKDKIEAIINSKEILDDYDKKALAFLQLKQTILEKTVPLHSDKEGTIVCHCDYHSGNLLCDEQGHVIGVCDWDHAGRCSPANDLLRSFNMCIVRNNFSNYQNLTLESKAFIKRYIENGGFVYTEKEMADAIELLYQKTLGSAWPMTDHYYHSNTKADHLLDADTEKVLYLRDKRGELLKFLMDCLD
jgi:aminoglycoside phosphotransferase (APT) family kinase protein